jgi:hypothetical protein
MGSSECLFCIRVDKLKVFLKMSHNNHAVLTMENLGIHFCKGNSIGLGFLADTSCLTLDPFHNMGFHFLQQRVSTYDLHNNLILCYGTFCICAVQNFIRELPYRMIKEGAIDSCSMLIGHGHLGPPVLFSDHDVADLQAAEALLLTSRVIG